MRVLVTGATGFVGAHTAKALLDAGHRVSALVRDRQRFEATMSALDVETPEAVVGDMTDPEAVGRALDGAEAVVHCAAVVTLDRRRGAEMLDANPRGLHNVVGGAVERGLDPIVHTSSTSALFQPAAGRLTGDLPVATATHAYGRSKALCETAAREYQAAGAPVVITYPSGILGPPAGDALGETAQEMARFVAAGVMPTRRAALSIIDVRDLAATNVALMEPGRGPRRVMCGGHLVTMDDLARLLRELTGRRFPIPPVPPAALRGAGRLLDQVRRLVPVDSPISAEAMTLVTRWAGTDDEQLSGLGIELRDPLETLGLSLRAWHRAGLITTRQLGAGRKRLDV